MSLFNNTQGGGTGGASASIFVTGLSEADTVTATKDGKTVKGKWGTKSIKVPYEIPVMTSDTTPSGKVSSSSKQNNADINYHAFDGDNTSTWWLPVSNATARETYLQYEFPSPVSIKTVNVIAKADYASGYSAFNFDWVIQASEDGQKWENITEAQNTASGLHEYALTSLDARFFKFIRFQITGSSTGYAHVANQYSAQVYSFQVDAYYTEPVDGHTITIKEYGLWTVTATNGEDTTTQDVLVDVAMDYEIEMGYEPNYLMLYDYGDECEDVTGGWNQNDTSNPIGYWTTIGKLTKNADNIGGSLSGGKKKYSLATVNSMDLSDCVGVSFVMSGSTGGTYAMFGFSLCDAIKEGATGEGASFIRATGESLLGKSATKNIYYYSLRSAIDYAAYASLIMTSEVGTESVNGNLYMFCAVKEDDWQTLCSKAGISTPSDLSTLIADTASITAILASEAAVKYMTAKCTGDFMALFVASSACRSALNASPYKSIVMANKHWKKFLAMVGVTA